MRRGAARSNLPMRRTACVISEASASQQAWNSGASRYSIGLPAFATTWRTAGSAATFAAAARSRCTTGSGVALGTNSSDHCAKRTGSPACVRLGTPGRATIAGPAPV